MSVPTAIVNIPSFPCAANPPPPAFGNVELFTGEGVNPGTIMTSSPYTDFSGFAIGSHEEAHTYQAQALGPFFFPAYFLNGGVSASNPYETQADKHAATGASPLP
jgi:hypothetical protein